VRADSVNVEQIMDQIRARIREKRGVDYTEQQIREMATAKLEKFLDPRGVRSDLLERFRNAQPTYTPPELPNYAFEESTLFDSHRAPLRAIRRLLLPVLKLFFNPGPLIQALNIQSKLNTLSAEADARREAARHGMDQLYYEVMHNLVVETTRMAIEVKNLKMKVESLTSRLEFNERRARALESVVVYKPADSDRTPTAARAAVGAAAGPVDAAAGPDTTPPTGAAPGAPGEGPGQRSRRRRRRRGRRGSTPAAAIMGAAPAEQKSAPADETEDEGPDDADGVEAESDATPASGAAPAQALASSPVPADTSASVAAPADERAADTAPASEQAPPAAGNEPDPDRQ
jgi:hypothetical protein